MELTTEVLSKFVGGVMEISNRVENHHYMGRIQEIEVKNETLIVKFYWLIKKDKNKQWKEVSPISYFGNLKICNLSDVGKDRLFICIPVVEETSILFLPTDSKLNQVEALRTS